MYQRAKPAAPARVPAGLAVMADEIESLPFGVVGERLPIVKAEPAPPPPQPLVIEPPPWAAEETAPLVALPASASASAAQPTALEVMRAEDGDSEWGATARPAARAAAAAAGRDTCT